jgi:hypothetical protein
LVGLGEDYVVANAAWKYKDGVSNLQWYFPAMGELGYLMPRFNVINNTITALGGLAVASNFYFWSSSEHCSNHIYGMRTNHGVVKDYNKHNSYYVRPFASF